MTCRPSLRLRLWTGAVLLALLAASGAGLAAYGVMRSQALAGEAMAAQRRIEGYAAYSARVSDWLLEWLRRDDGVQPDPAPVLAALDALDAMIGADVAAMPPGPEAELRQRQSLAPGRLRGFFRQLQRTFAENPPGTAAGEAAVAFYAAQAPVLAAQQIDFDTRRRDQALAAMEALRRPMTLFALAVGLSALVILLALYLLVLRPMFARLGEATAKAELMAQGGAIASQAGHDELGLMFAKLRQIGARLDRRRAALKQGYDQLEGTVSERTSALQAANARLAHIDASRRRFFADVGHELRTPLTVILGEAELGASHADPAVRAGFLTVRQRAERLFRRIEDLLRIARSESGQLELQKGRVALAKVVELAQADVAPLLRRGGLSVASDLDSLHLNVDGDWLRQVFAGLLENAAKYAGRGAKVTITARPEGDQALVDISDTGTGLAEGIDPFDRFSHAGPSPGFGVGLALARWVVEASGGRLEIVQSGTSAGEAEGAGRGFHLRMWLPLWEEA